MCTGKKTQTQKHMSRRRTPPSSIFKVEKVQSLKRGFKDHGKAQEILERIAKEVKYISYKNLFLETRKQKT